MKFKRRLQVDEEGIPITNLVDVLFLLIVFFMTSTVLSFDRGFDVKLPETASSGQISKKGVTVMISADGGLRVDGIPVALNRLGPLVAERRPISGDSVILHTDKTTQYQIIADVMDQLLLVGINDVALPVVERN